MEGIPYRKTVVAGVLLGCFEVLAVLPHAASCLRNQDHARTPGAKLA